MQPAQDDAPAQKADACAQTNACVPTDVPAQTDAAAQKTDAHAQTDACAQIDAPAQTDTLCAFPGHLLHVSECRLHDPARNLNQL